MKINKIVLIGTAAFSTYKLINFLNNEENILWLKNLKNNLINTNKKRQDFSQKLNHLNYEIQESVIPSFKQLNKESNEFQFIVNKKLNQLNRHFKKLNI